MSIDSQIAALSVRLGDAFQQYEATAQDLANISTASAALASDSASSASIARDQAVEARNDVLTSGAVPQNRQVATGTGLTGGGDLSANRTLSVDNTVVRTSRTVATGTGLTGGGNLSSNRTLSVDNTVVRTSGDFTINGQLQLDNPNLRLNRSGTEVWNAYVDPTGNFGLWTGFNKDRKVMFNASGNIWSDYPGWNTWLFSDSDGGVAINAQRAVKFSSGGRLFVSTNNFVDLHWSDGALYYNIDGNTGYRQFTFSGSDEKLKNIDGPVTVENAIETVRSMAPIMYSFKEELPFWNPEGTHWGFTAQNVQQLFPSAVESVGMPNKEETYLALNNTASTQMIAALTKTVQHLLDEVADLKARLGDN